MADIGDPVRRRIVIPDDLPVPTPVPVKEPVKEPA
jgi:hypothetical protein